MQADIVVEQEKLNSCTDLVEKKQLKIAMFTNNYFPFIGGVPISISRLTKELRKQGHIVYIFAPQYPKQPADLDPYIIRCKLLRYHKTNIFNFAIVNIFLPDIKKEFTKHDFDLIHVHHPFWMGKKGMKLAKKYKIPIVLTYHTRFDKYYHYVPVAKRFFKNILSHQIVKKFSQKCTMIFAPTETSKEYLTEIGITREIEVLPTGIDFDIFKELKFDIFKGVKEETIRSKYTKKGEALLCSVSRLSEEKNIYFMIDGIKYVKERANIPFKCIIVGEGPEKENIMNKIQEEGLSDTIILVGNIPPDEISKYYLASDFFVFSSKSETQGMVLLEAMASFCPVVAVSAGGIEDVVIDGHNGYKTNEDISEWGKKVIELLSDETKLDKMSKNAHEYAKKFSLELMARHAADVYIRAIEKCKKGKDK